MIAAVMRTQYLAETFLKKYAMGNISNNSFTFSQSSGKRSLHCNPKILTICVYEI